MASQSLAKAADGYLRHVCEELGSRSVGSVGNRATSAFFARTVASFGFHTDTPSFPCMDWSSDHAQLTVGDATFAVAASPYTQGCQVRGRLVAAATVEELEALDADGAVLLVRGALCREPLMPKNFPFYNPAEHQRIVQALERARPAAIVAATGRHPELGGALNPFPLIEDGDFDVPSAYMTDAEGLRLAASVGQDAALTLDAERRAATGCNVVATKAVAGAPRVVLCAHLDAKAGTPGALDNATGIVTLLLLAELLVHYTGRLGVELVAMNGEDYYSNPGEQLYLAQAADRFGDIVLGVNLDGLGYIHGRTAYSLYDCSNDLAGTIRQVFAAHSGYTEGPAWYQGDHSLFLLHQRPALALTSERSLELITTIVHTAQDSRELVAVERLVETAYILRDLVVALDYVVTGDTAGPTPAGEALLGVERR